MTPLPTTMQHFTHPQHSIILHDDTTNPKYLCEGCRTYGFGTRYHCHACTFNLHEYCASCPRILSSFMHPLHSLRLVERNHLHERFCNICLDPIEGLSYRCELCEFDVHPICTLLQETLRHVLHQRHPRLLGSAEPGTCVVCRGACNTSSWRYRCALCGFDIHIGCVSVQCQKTMNHRRIPTYVPPSVFPQQRYFGAYPSPNHFPGPSNMHHYNYNMPQYPQQYQHHHFGGYPSPNHFPGPSNMHHYNYNMPQYPQQYQHHYFGGYPSPNHFPGPSNMHHYNYNMPQYPQQYQQHQGHGQAQTHYGVNSGQIGQVIFNLVQAIGTGVVSDMIFGVDAFSLFAS